jgi:DNA-binding NarL/FixJ family response regulator
VRLVAEMSGRIRVVTIGSPTHLDELGTWVGALTDDISVISGATTATRGLEEVVEHVPDIVIVHFEPYAVETYDLVHALLTRFPAMRIVVLTSFSTAESLWQLFRAGVRAVLHRDTAPEDLVTALRAVQSGHTLLGAHATKGLFATDGARTPLRRAELQILKLLAQGLSYDEIATRLAISQSTLKRYLRDIETRLNAKNRVQAVANATRQGLI